MLVRIEMIKNALVLFFQTSIENQRIFLITRKDFEIRWELSDDPLLS